MAVRDLDWNDFEGWVDLYYARYEEVERNPDLGVYLFPTRPSRAEEATVFAQFMKGVLDRDIVVAVAERDGRLEGVCSVHRRGRHLEDRHLGTLGIYVHPDRRGQGVGDALLGAALERCRGLFEIVELKVVATNPARRLYERHGFRPFGEQPRSFKRGDRYLNDLLMWRPVEAASSPPRATERPGPA